MELYKRIEDVLKRNSVDLDHNSKETIAEELKRQNQQLSELNHEFKTLFNDALVAVLSHHERNLTLNCSMYFCEVIESE